MADRTLVLDRITTRREIAVLEKYPLLGVITAFIVLAALPVAAADQISTGLVEQMAEVLDAPDLAAEEPPADGFQSPVGIFLSEPDDRAIRVLKVAEKYRKQEKWADAIAAYQVLIDEEVVSDYPAAEGVYIPIDEYCRRRLLTLPDAAVQVYMTLNDPAAAAQYQKALAANSAELLEKTASHYPISSVALNALCHAADLHLEAGDYGRALDGYRNVLARLHLCSRSGRSALPATAEFDPVAVGIKTAACLRVIGSEAKAERLLDMLAAAKTGTEELDQWLRRVRSISERQPPQPDWGTFGGGNAHSETPEKAVLPGRLRWHQEEKDPADREARAGTVAGPTRATIPKMMCSPVVSGGTVYYRTESTVSARDILQGKQVWQYTEVMRDRQGRVINNRRVFSRRSGGSFFLTEGRDKIFANIMHVSFANNRMDYRYKLVALDAHGLENEPVVAWERGGATEKDEDLSDLSFTSAPVITDDGKVIAGAMKVPGEDVYLCAFDAETGKLLWKTFICIGQARIRYDYRSGNGVAELPAEKDGVVYFALNVGVAAAVDAQSGRVIWKNVYESSFDEDARSMFISFFRPNNPPVISGGKLYVLPADSEFLYAFDRSSGKVVWRYPIGSDYYYLMGIKDNNIVVSGTRLASISESGKMGWSLQLGSASQGRGVLAEDFAICPLEEGIEMIRLETGRFVGMDRPYAPWDEWLMLQKNLRGAVASGNLLIAGNKLIIAGEESLQVYDERVNPEEVLAKLEKSPNSPTLHSELASYYLWQGEYSRAAIEYELAYELIQKQGGRLKLAETLLGDLFTIYMDLGDSEFADGNFAAALRRFERAFDRAPQEEARLQALVKVGETHAALADFVPAVDTFQNIISEYANVSFHPDSTLLVQARVFAESRIAELLRKHGREPYAQYDAQALNVLESQQNPVAAAKEVLRQYPNSRFLAQCLLRVAKQSIKEKDFRTAGSYLALLLRRRPDAAQKDEAADLLAMCLEKQGLARHPAIAESIFPPLEQKWSVEVDAGDNHARLMQVPMIDDAMEELFYVAVGKNIYCRRASDGSELWRNTAGWLGVSLRDAGPQIKGAEIGDVIENTPAHAAGFMAGDVIVEFDGNQVEDTQQLIRICGNTPAETELKVKVMRHRQAVELEVTLGKRPAQHDYVQLGDQIYLAGVAAVDDAQNADLQRQALVLSRDRYIQAVDPITGQVFEKFPITAVPRNPYALAEPTPRDGMTVVDGRRILAVTGGEARVQIMPGQMRPQAITRENEVAMWDLTTGEPLWQFDTVRKPIADPHVVGNVAVVVEMEEHNLAFITFYSTETGRRLNQIGPLNAVGSSLEIIDLAGGKIALAVGREIYCLSVDEDAGAIGRQVWSRHMETSDLKVLQVLPSIRKLGKELLLAATEDLEVEVIDAASGRSLWSLVPRPGARLEQIQADEEGIYVCSRGFGQKALNIEAYTVENGERLWQTEAKYAFAPDSLITDSYLVLALGEENSQPQNPRFAAPVSRGAAELLVIDKKNGKQVQAIEFKNTLLHDLQVVDGVLILVTQDAVIGYGAQGPKT